MSPDRHRFMQFSTDGDGVPDKADPLLPGTPPSPVSAELVAARTLPLTSSSGLAASRTVFLKTFDPPTSRRTVRMSEAAPALHETSNGDPAGAADLLPLVYEELRRLAARRLAGESKEHTLQPTALVHEAWLRIEASGTRVWRDRQHFFAVAAEAMRRILVDRARRRQAAKRGCQPERVALDEMDLAAPETDERLLAMNDALEKLAAVHPRKAELVRLRYFAGLSFEETAEVLGIAVPTAKQWWAYARAWLKVEMTSAASCAGEISSED